MGKHSAPSDPTPPPGNVTDDTWTKLMLAGASQANSGQWAENAARNAENARDN
jgi:hypothetical protein